MRGAAAEGQGRAESPGAGLLVLRHIRQCSGGADLPSSPLLQQAVRTSQFESWPLNNMRVLLSAYHIICSLLARARQGHPSSDPERPEQLSKGAITISTPSLHGPRAPEAALARHRSIKLTPSRQGLMIPGKAPARPVHHSFEHSDDLGAKQVSPAPFDHGTDEQWTKLAEAHGWLHKCRISIRSLPENGLPASRAEPE